MTFTMSDNAEVKKEKTKVAQDEEKALDFWQKNNIFEKTLKKPSPKGEFVFYDGPPFATGTPHYGHILAGTIKDVIPRYRTMQGYHVERRWGWDCHGLPIEKLVQEENNLKSKKDIEEFGIKKFSEYAKKSVFRYDAQWKKIVPRTGRWVDMENQYTTMDSGFMESVWWAFKKLYDKGLIYEDFKSMHISPILETPLSNFEVNLDYRDITDISTYVKFELLDELENVSKLEISNTKTKTYLIAWTTTPWTLFGNVALAVGNDIEYVKIKLTDQNSIQKTEQDSDSKNSAELFILAKNRISAVLKNKSYEIIGELKGSDLIGKKYKPVFDHYYKKTDLENKENGWKIYHGDFVTTEDGSGIVHIAPAFGEDDLKLAQKHKLPFVQHVNIDGSIKSEITELTGRQAKPKSTEQKPNAHQETDIEVIKMLAHQGSLFEKEKFIHSYPHCWRTGAPLLNYALSSWFVKVTQYNKRMFELNKSINWVPKNVGEKRFGNWLENVKDWGISRSRYWGTSMPIWKSEDDSEIEVIGSIEELRTKTKSTNNYFVMRHGEAEHNLTYIWNCDNSKLAYLTEKGKEQVKKIADELKNKKIDFIYYSPLVRTKETAEIIAEKIGLAKENLILDKRIREMNAGIFNGKSGELYHKFYEENKLDYFVDRPEGGENLVDVKKRVGEFLYEIDKKHQNKNILIVSHYSPIHMLIAVAFGLNNKKADELENEKDGFIKTGELKELNFAPIPHDDEYVLDLHRPYIDDITFIKNEKIMKRIPEVFDTWFDSGSMPYAVPHFPFEKDEKKEMLPPKKIFNFSIKKGKRFPADFIAEGLDQTRGWFYTLLALNTALFDEVPYKNVIVNGLVLAEDGRKMSKNLKNYPDPELIFEKYGADAMRYYMLSSAIVEAEPLSFSEKGVDEIYKKIIARLLNVTSFYEMYVDKADQEKVKNMSEEFLSDSTNVLDRWIIARLNQVIEQTTTSIEKYELNNSCRPFFDFVDDLSTWYLRRSRDRFKDSNSKDKDDAIKTTFYILNQFSKVIAPFMPFVSENIYQKIHNYDFSNSEKSIHLQSWPISKKIDVDLIEKMKIVRDFVSFALLARDKVSIKVRQPLQALKINISSDKLNSDLIYLIKDEVNVKEVICDTTIGLEKVHLDTKITEELKEEGTIRELNRFIQTIRKEKNLSPNEKVEFSVQTNESGQKFIEKFMLEISELIRASKIYFEENDGQEINLSEMQFKISIK
ncbi:MAG TPA: class I tRNA ligase family protein [Candidatus Paceibacterota bacterium]|nr:class I tRNA ligase family protein [Candidatus Paceibacterota bacterium]